MALNFCLDGPGVAQRLSMMGILLCKRKCFSFAKPCVGDIKTEVCFYTTFLTVTADSAWSNTPATLSVPVALTPPGMVAEH